MKCKIMGNNVDTNEINVIAIDGTIFRAYLAECHVTFKLRSGETINYESVPSYEHAMVQMSEIIKFLQSHSLNNFAVLDDRFVINMDNTRRLAWKANALGLNVVEAICKNRHAYTLYEGRDEDYAEHLMSEYDKQEAKYLQAQPTEG